MAYQYAALAAFQIISGAQQAETIRGNAELSKQINNMNAEYAEIDAHNAELEGYGGAARYQSVIDSTLSAQKVSYASQDVDINYGSAKDIEAETKLTGFLNQLDIKNQAHAKALGYKNQARSYRLGAYTAAAEGAAQAGAAQTAGLLRAAETGVAAYNESTGYSRKGGVEKPKAIRVSSMYLTNKGSWDSMS